MITLFYLLYMSYNFINCDTNILRYGYLKSQSIISCRDINRVPPIIQVSWYSENGSTTTTTLVDVFHHKIKPHYPNFNVTDCTYDLIIKNTSIKHESLYRCSFKDKNGIKEQIYNFTVLDNSGGVLWLDIITVYSPSGELLLPNTRNVDPGTEIIFEAIAYNYRGLNKIQWYKNNKITTIYKNSTHNMAGTPNYKRHNSAVSILIQEPTNIRVVITGSDGTIWGEKYVNIFPTEISNASVVTIGPNSTVNINNGGYKISNAIVTFITLQLIILQKYF